MSEPTSIKDALAQFTEANHPELLAVREEITALVNADADTIFNVVEERLGTIYDDAEQRGDTSTMQLATDAYQHAKELYQVNDQLTGVAVASTAAMNKAVEERDDLVEAIEERDKRHPLIGQLIQAVREEKMYDDEIKTYDHLQDMLLENACENAHDLLGIESSNVAGKIAMAICFGYDGSYNGDGGIPEETLLAIGRFIEEKLGAQNASV